MNHVAFFQSLEKTLAAGVGLLILIMLLVGLATGQFVRLGDPLWWAFFMRWLHVLSGVMWIGLLWYLNFVQTPTMPKIEPVEHRAAVIKFIAPNVLFTAARCSTGSILGIVGVCTKFKYHNR